MGAVDQVRFQGRITGSVKDRQQSVKVSAVVGLRRITDTQQQTRMKKGCRNMGNAEGSNAPTIGTLVRCMVDWT